MGIPLSEVIDILNLPLESVKSGIPNLNNEVTRVNVLEAPDAIKWLEGGELLLTTGFALQGKAEFQIEFLHQLADKGIAGLGIKAGRYLDPIPKTMIDAANRLNFPIIELPSTVPLSQVITPIYEVLLNHQVQQLKKSQEIHFKFLEIVLAGEGFSDICRVLKDLIQAPVLVTDKCGQVMGQSCEEDLGDHYLENLIYFTNNLNSQVFEAPSLDTYQPYRIALNNRENQNSDFVFYPVVGGQCVWGFLVVVNQARDLDTQDIIACQHAATIAALEFIKYNAVIQGDLKRESDLLEDILEGNFSSWQVIQTGLGRFGISLQGDYLVFILKIVDAEHGFKEDCKKAHSFFPKVKNQIYKTLKDWFKDFSGGTLAAEKNNSIITLVSIQDQQAENKFRWLLKQLSMRFKQKFPQISIYFGVGAAYPQVENIKKSYEEAVIALKAGPLAADVRISYYRELGAYVCLSELRNSTIAANFSKDLIASLEQYDTVHGTDLVHTLEVYFNCNENARETARTLFMHRNSLEYRLRCIEKLTSKKLSCPEEKFDLRLALILRKILQK